MSLLVDGNHQDDKHQEDREHERPTDSGSAERQRPLDAAVENLRAEETRLDEAVLSEPHTDASDALPQPPEVPGEDSASRDSEPSSLELESDSATGFPKLATEGSDSARARRPIPTAEDLQLPQIVLDLDRMESFEIRQNVHHYEVSRCSVARLIAFLMACVGGAQIAVAIWQSGWLSESELQRLPHWATAAMFLGGLHLAYAFFLSQIGDWSGNWVATSFLLVGSGLFACLAVLLSLAPPNNVVIRWLELPYVLQAKAAIWSVIMVLVLASLAWWCGREAMVWRETVAWLEALRDRPLES